MRPLSQEQYNTLCIRRATEGRRWISYDQANRQHMRPTSAMRQRRPPPAPVVQQAKAPAGCPPTGPAGQPGQHHGTEEMYSPHPKPGAPASVPATSAQQQGPDAHPDNWVEIRSFTEGATPPGSSQAAGSADPIAPRPKPPRSPPRRPPSPPPSRRRRSSSSTTEEAAAFGGRGAREPNLVVQEMADLDRGAPGRRSARPYSSEPREHQIPGNFTTGEVTSAPPPKRGTGPPLSWLRPPPSPRRPLTDSQLERLTRTMTRALRHSPTELGLRLDERGACAVDEMLEAPAMKKMKANRVEIFRAVRVQAKRRLVIEGEGPRAQIRALNGHSSHIFLNDALVHREISREEAPTANVAGALYPTRLAFQP